MDLWKDTWSNIIAPLAVTLIGGFSILLATALHLSPMTIIVIILILLFSLVELTYIKVKNPKLTRFVGFIIIVLAILLVGSVVTDLKSVSNEPTAPSELTENISTSTCSISVSSSPVGASVYLDGKYKGEVPQFLNDIGQGSHLITLKLAGYEEWSQEVSVDANKTFSISPTLIPKENPEANSPPGTKENTSTDEATQVKLESKNNSIGMKFVRIPAGTFYMGDKDLYNPFEEEYFASPEHEVVFEKDFYIGIYEVTQGQWIDIMHSKPLGYQGDDYPVVNISWYDMQDFITKLNKKEHTTKYRLPSEAEWEYACRAGTTTEYYFGDDASKLDEYEWYQRNSLNKLHPVGQKKPNHWGLYDMEGNVCERTQDAWHENYGIEGVEAPQDGSSWGNAADSIYGVMRGNSYKDPAECSISADRFSWTIGDSIIPDAREDFGFRLVMEL